MAFKISDRIFIGLILVLTIFFSYLLNLDNILLLLILILVTYDFYKINTNLFFLLSISIISIILFLLAPYQSFKYLFILNIFLTICIFLKTNFKKEFFLLSMYFFCLILFYLSSLNRDIFYTIILISFFNDTIAYFSGKYVRGPLIIPTISPNKTWSGTSISFFSTSILLYFFDYNIYFSALIAILLFFGDVFFSFIKRHLNIKDFSLLLGDHGGILDRLDSMFFVAIIFQIYLIKLL